MPASPNDRRPEVNMTARDPLSPAPLVVLLGALLAPAAPGLGADFPTFEAQEIDPHVGNVCYALTVADVDADGKPDVVALSEDAAVWYRNPTWEKHEIVRGLTAKDNVCIQPHDIDGDGRVDFAIGAGWKPPNTNESSTLQWVGRDAEGTWRLHPIAFDEPMIHRIRWADVLGNGKPQLVVAPLQGRTTKGPDWGEGPGVRLLVYSVPEDPTRPDWPVEVAESTLHTVHNLWPTDFDADGRAEVLAAAWEGVFLIGREGDDWRTTKLGTGHQEGDGNKGASEIKLGTLADGTRYVATIEPWHGFQVVVYWPKAGDNPLLFDRHVIDEPVTWGHAVWCADLDGDGDEELIIGQRDPNGEGAEPKGPGVRVYDFGKASASDAKGRPFSVTRHVLDDGGMACEDALAADLDGDGRPEVLAGGRATHNVKIYWNRGR
jgi:hypothetical protein